MTPPKDIHSQYRGTGGELFPLALRLAVLTLLTLGIYRFWGKTRIRKYIWSSTLGDGDAFEYTGTGLEKFLGFLVAIVALAVYLGVVQMLLFFFGLNYGADSDTVEGMIALNAILSLNVLALLPLIFYATYRARRYKMARTRWRGVRFGMEKGAWGYAARAIGYGLLTLLSFGALLPLGTFKLEKYMADRSSFGDARFEQGGAWTALYGAAKHMFIGFGVVLLALLSGSVMGAAGLAVLGGVIGYIWLMVGFVYYRVHSFRYMAAHRTLGQKITFTATPTTGEVIKIYIIGSLLMSLVVAVMSFTATALLSGLMSLLNVSNMGLVGLFGGVIYIFALVLLGAMALVFITQPTIAHFITNFSVHNAEALDEIQQRATETGVDAEGFADALDIGGAI